MGGLGEEGSRIYFLVIVVRTEAKTQLLHYLCHKIFKSEDWMNTVNKIFTCLCCSQVAC